jgi:hypothetical protein
MGSLLANITPKELGLSNNPATLNSLPATIVSVLFYLAGALAVIFILVGALQYVTSAGDPKRTASAKNTILYALVGLALVIFAGSIVRYLVSHL